MSSSQIIYGCPVEVTLEVICGKWKCTILWWLRRGAKRFGELMQLIPRITQKVLTKQLRELEKDGLIERQVYKGKPRRVEYSLTSEGETLRPILQLMCDWGKAKMPEFEFCPINLEGLHVLVLTDAADVRELFSVELGAVGKARVTTISLSSGVENVAQIQPDVIVADMEEQDLNPLFRQINLLEAELGKTIPTIALTQIANRTRAWGFGFQLVFTQPVEAVEVAVAIASLSGRLG